MAATRGSNRGRRRWHRRAGGLLVLALAAACAETGDDYYRPIDPADYPAATGPGEHRQPGEIDAAARVAAIIEARIRRQFPPPGVLRRDAHPKAHGCLRGRFAVRPDLPPALRVGVFKPGTGYDAIVRFSNANEDPSVPDTEPDGRGMAIKLLSVGQPLLLPHPDTPDVQDFIMISHPVFLVADPRTYQTLVGYVDSDDWLTRQLEPLLAAVTLGWRGTLNAIAISSNQTDSPLNTRYWSMVAYQLGTGADARAIKFSAMPCAPRPGRRPATAGPDYLRQAMKDDLATGTACMRFMVQPRTAETQSVEDPRHEWPESEAPFVDVARLTFAPQRFESPAALAACERLRFSPWHGLVDHRPLGAVNRMRKVIYQRIGMARQQRAAAAAAARTVAPEPHRSDAGD